MSFFENTLINTVTLIEKEETVYENGIAVPNYTSQGELKVRISGLNYKDLQFLDKVADVKTETLKMYAVHDTPIQLKDKIIRKGEKYKVISEYLVQSFTGPHHKKFYIQKIG